MDKQGEATEVKNKTRKKGTDNAGKRSAQKRFGRIEYIGKGKATNC